jgi:hypothetical protein
MRRCDPCGAWFDELHDQIVVPGSGLAFDSVDCASALFASEQHAPLLDRERRLRPVEA